MSSNPRFSFGALAVGIYMFSVVLGGFVYPEYSHISSDVSQLTSNNSPIRSLINPFFFLYNLSLIISGIRMLKHTHTSYFFLGICSIMVVGILGLFLSAYPINTRGTPFTNDAMIHIGIVSCISLFTVFSTLCFWVAARRAKAAKLATVSRALGIAFLVAGPIAAMSVQSPYAGLTERVAIGIFLFWILYLSQYETALFSHRQT